MVIAMYMGNNTCLYSSSLSTLIRKVGIGKREWSLYSHVFKEIRQYTVYNDQVKDFKIRRI